MPLYEYRCQRHGRFEAFKPIEDRHNGMCPDCGKPAELMMSIVHDHWPLILTEQSHHKGAKDEWVPDKPSNDMIVDNSKDPYVKTIY